MYMYLPCGVESKKTVVSTVLSVELTEVERVWKETVNQSTECQSVAPTAREIRHVDTLCPIGTSRPQ